MVSVCSAGDFYDESSEDYRLEIKHTGLITWSFGGHISTKCGILVDKFPFDQQICDFTLINWMYDELSVNLTLQNTSIDTEHYVENVEWDLLDTMCERGSVSSNLMKL